MCSGPLRGGESISLSDQAVAQVLAFLAAGVIFVAALGAALFATVNIGRDTASVDDSVNEREARSLADVLVGSTGTGWENGADDAKRLGLRAPNGGLDTDRMQLLKGAGTAASANGLLDYEEALGSLGLDADGGTQFHLRIHPVGLQSTITQADLSGVRIAYIGDWDSLPVVGVAFNTDASIMVADADATLAPYAAVSVRTERDLLTDIGLGFKDQVHIGATAPSVQVDVLGIPTPISSLVSAEELAGDVYPDIKSYLDIILPGRLSQYHIVVVGTGVDQSTLTSDTTKHAIRDWVLAGGTLMVLGSEKQNVQWLKPLFSVGTSTTNVGLMAPDVGHPLLKEPTRLDWPRYDHHGLGWDLNKEQENFQVVLQDGGSSVMTVSRDGSFGDGRIFLSTFRPHEIAAQSGAGEAAGLIHNMVVYSERNDLYLDYGAEIPIGTDISVGVRLSYAMDARLGQVPMRVEVHAWRT